MSVQMDGVISEIDPMHFVHPTLSFLRGYWDKKRAGRLMPARADISPSDLREHLGWVLMLDVLPQAQGFRYRLIGTLVTQYFLSDWTGRTVSEAFAIQGEGAVKAVNAAFRKVARDRVVLRCAGNPDWLKGAEQFEAIYLPLSDDGETVSQILHAFVFDRPQVLMAREIAKAHGAQPMLASAKSAI